MAGLFETYEADFQMAMQEANLKMAAVGRDPAQRRTALQAIEHATDEALEILDQMSVEVQNLPAAQRLTQNQKTRRLRGEAEAAKAKLRQLMDEEDRGALFGSRYTDEEAGIGGVGGGGGGGVGGDQRKTLLGTQASLQRTSERLRESQQIAYETEGIGGNILNDLRAQREQIESLRNTLGAADTYVDKSVQTLKLMLRRITANKYISYAIIAVLVLLIVLVLASKIF